MITQEQLYATTDALVWAQGFMERVEANPDLVIDEGLMIGWFANAIETTRRLVEVIPDDQM